METYYKKAMVLYLMDMSLCAVSSSDDGISGIFPFQERNIDDFVLGNSKVEEIWIKEDNDKIDIKMLFNQKDGASFKYEFTHNGKYFIIWDSNQ